jgi:hypothetical protein
MGGCHASDCQLSGVFGRVTEPITYSGVQDLECPTRGWLDFPTAAIRPASSPLQESVNKSFLHTPGKLRIVGIAQAIADQIDGQHGHGHKEAREENNPEGQLDVGTAFSSNNQANKRTHGGYAHAHDE